LRTTTDEMSEWGILLHRMSPKMVHSVRVSVDGDNWRSSNQSVRIDRPFNGWGKVAQLLASRQPQGLEGLVLVAPARPTPQNIPEPARQQRLYAYDNRENALQALAFLRARMPVGDVQEQIISNNLAGSLQAKLAWPTSSAYEDISPYVNSIAVRTLIVAGEQDRQDPLEQHRREVLPRIPGAKLHVIPRSGHLLPIDQPEELANLIHKFVVFAD